VVVDDLDAPGIAFMPAKADPPLPVDAELSRAIAGERFQAVARQSPKILEAACSSQDLQALLRLVAKAIKPPDPCALVQCLGVPVGEAPDHRTRIWACRVTSKAVSPRILLIAEELPNSWYVTQERVDTPWAGDWHGPFDAQWADPFHDRFKAALTGGHLDNLYEAFTAFGDSWHDALIYSESHDEVGNTDDRIAKRGRDGKGWEMNQLAAAGTILGRGVPMLFMGQEAGETMQFGQDNDKLPARSPGAHDPGTGSNWWDDRLALDAYEADPGRSKLRAWTRRMLEIRRGDLGRLAGSDVEITHIHNDNGVVAFTRDGGKYVVVLNFKNGSWDRYDIGVRGRYQELANTSWPAFNLGGYPEKTRGGGTAHDISDVPIPSYGAVALVRWD
jgi:1,4-alpha-glucan branching enzyme